MDASGNFVVAWQSFEQDGNDYGIYARMYDSSGNPLGPEFQVNTYTNGLQEYPSVAMEANGNFVIAWQSFGQDGSDYGIYARRYLYIGKPYAPEFQVNTYTTSFQGDPSVAMDAYGDFVVAWNSLGQDGDNSGVYAQRYDSSGNPLGPEFQVNTTTVFNQQKPSVAMDASGNFVVAWQSFGQDGDGDGVYAQGYVSNGSPVGSEFQVNTYTVSHQRYPSVAMDANGNFVVVWTSDGQDGDGHGVFKSLVILDQDGDGILDEVDNCPYTPNTDQLDTNNNGIGDACEIDSDGDGYLAFDDCDDSDPSVNPGATEVCDGIDNDCDDFIDEGFTDTDVDGIADCSDICPNDGFNDADADGVCQSDGDCDDTDPNVYPGNIEVPNGIDDNCNGSVDETLGGSASRVSPEKVVCRNLDTRQTVVMQGGGYSFDCEGAGLTLTPGDRIDIIIKGTAE
jgi:hypothetical protein